MLFDDTMHCFSVASVLLQWAMGCVMDQLLGCTAESGKTGSKLWILNSHAVNVAEEYAVCAVAVRWLDSWTQALKGPVQIAATTLSGNSLRQTVYTHCACVHQAAKLVAALLRFAGVTAGLVESNGSLPPGLWLTSLTGWLPSTGISSGTLRSVIECGLALPLCCCYGAGCCIRFSSSCVRKMSLSVHSCRVSRSHHSVSNSPLCSSIQCVLSHTHTHTHTHV